MPDHPQSTPSTAAGDPRRTTAAERAAQSVLMETAGALATVRNRLWVLHVRLGERPEDDDMGEGRAPDSVRFSIRGAIECVNEDHLDTAILALEKAARDTPASLTREWRKRKAERQE